MMRDELAMPWSAPPRPSSDGWLGTRELPGYRAGNVVARLADLPSVDPDHLYFNLLLLDAAGQLQDHHSGPCPSLGRQWSIDERSRYVRVVAELLRHAPSEDRGLSAVGQALTFVRERGIAGDRLLLAAQLLDEACSDSAVVASLAHLLALSLGIDEAPSEMGLVVRRLADQVGLDAFDAAGRLAPVADVASGVDRINSRGLAAQVGFVVRKIGKARSRRYLREATGLALVPTPELLGV